MTDTPAPTPEQLAEIKKLRHAATYGAYYALQCHREMTRGAGYPDDETLRDYQGEALTVADDSVRDFPEGT